MGIVCEKPFQELPKSENVIAFVIETRKYLFPGFFEEVKPNLEEYLNAKLTAIKFLFLKNICNDKDKLAIFIDKLEEINIALKDDLHFFYDSDPACEGDEEIVLTYPGYFAITYHRIAHVLYDLNIKVLPRIISEYAHSRTGIDIHPGATISHPFFIDHGTGIVIGETAVIGHHVKIYHGVTLGALSLSAGQKLKGTKRHPTVGNYVTIYAGASILGGKTIVGDNVTIGSNVFLVDSVLPNSKVLMDAKKV